jgi:hypothetical protein
VGATEGAARSHLPHTVPVDRFSEKKLTIADNLRLDDEHIRDVCGIALI